MTYFFPWWRLTLLALIARPRSPPPLGLELHVGRVRMGDKSYTGLPSRQARFFIPSLPWHFPLPRSWSWNAQKYEGGLEMWRRISVGTLLQDLRYAFRMLVKNPGFTTVAVLTLALGIGATTAIFTVVNAVLLRPLPYPHPEELVYVQKNLPPPYGIIPFAGNREFVAWRNQSRTLSPVAAYMYSWFNLTGGGEPERVTCGLATASFFSLLGVHPVVGRLFLPQEDRPGGPPVVMLSDALWKRRYGGDPSVVGRGLTPGWQDLHRCGGASCDLRHSRSV